jgi:hypothetical protein
MLEIEKKAQTKFYLKRMVEIGDEYIKWLKFYTTSLGSSDPAKNCLISNNAENIISMISCFKKKLRSIE